MKVSLFKNGEILGRVRKLGRSEGGGGAHSLPVVFISPSCPVIKLWVCQDVGSYFLHFDEFNKIDSTRLCLAESVID